MKFTALALAGFAFASVDAFSIHKYPSSFAGARATPGARTRSNEQLASPFRPGPLSATVGVVGATGAVGKEILGCLENRAFPVDKLRIFGSARSAGSTVKTKWGDVTVELFDSKAAAETDVCFLAVSGDFALEHAKDIAKGSIVIDNSSAFRYMPDIPLVVPEINGKTCKGKNLIANPNCTTAIGLMALDPLMKKFGAKRVIMSTYQASSGAGQEGMDELKEGTIAVVSGERDVAENKVSKRWCRDYHLLPPTLPCPALPRTYNNPNPSPSPPHRSSPTPSPSMSFPTSTSSRTMATPRRR